MVPDIIIRVLFLSAEGPWRYAILLLEWSARAALAGAAPVLWGATLGANVGTLLAAVLFSYLLALDAVATCYAALFGAAAGAAAVVAVRQLGHAVRRVWLRTLVGIVLVPPVLWLGTDLLYSILARRSYALWEAGIRRDSDGVRRGCREFTLGDGPTAILLVHGFGDSPSVYKRLAADLAERRLVPGLASSAFTVEAMRLPHFAMPFDDNRKATADELSAAVAERLKALRKNHKRVVVVAHSFGAAVTIDALANHPNLADGAVFLAPLIEVSGKRSPLISPRQWFNLFDNLLVFTDRVGGIFPPDLTEVEVKALLNIDRFIPREVYRQLFLLVDRNRDRAKSFPVPLLMILCDRDPVIDNAAARRFLEECPVTPGHFTRLVELHESSHVIPLDLEYRTVADEITRWARHIPARRG